MTTICLLISTLCITTALLTTEEVVALADGKKIGSSDSTVSSAPKSGADGLGTKDAPVDGKDGRPHLGPFVETSAERDRKKAKESGEEDKISKPVPSVVASGVPETNDGVMDDPNRTGPKEGTRGTEGGISEKGKDKKEGQADGEKKPDPPKEAPPLPHSEQQSLGQKPTKDDAKKGKETGTDDEDKKKDGKQKELGGLEVGKCYEGFIEHY